MPAKTPAPKSSNRKKAEKYYHMIFAPKTRPANYVFSLGVTVIKIAIILVLIIGVSGIGVVMGVAKAYYETIPELSMTSITQQNLSSFIYDRHGALMTTYKGTENRIWAEIDEIPTMLQDAFVAVEDARFYTHDGVDIKRIVGAFVNNMRNDSVQGGSTITQQLVKTRLLSTEQTYKRKIQEAYIAMEMEEEYSKEQILEWYLNTIPLGASNYGIKAAAMDYFGKDLNELTLRECATLAGITRNPTRYNPRRSYYVREVPEDSMQRTNYVLQCMYESNFITEAEYIQALGRSTELKQHFDNGEISEEVYRNALREEFPVVEENTANALYDMPTAVETVLDDVATALLRKNGLTDTRANRSAMRTQIQTGGYRIYSTIDPQVQKIAEDVVYNWDEWPEAVEPYSVTTDPNTGIRYETVQPQAAVSIFDYTSGEIVAVIGSRTPPKGQLEKNLAKSALSVGSAIKPIAVYGPALDKGASPASIESNLPVPIEGWNTTKGYPSNSTKGDYKGFVTLRQGMRASLNTVAANTLMNRVTVNDSKNYLISLGIDPSNIQATPAGLSLGSTGISTIEMSVAFGTVANSGTYQMPLTFTKVVDSDNNIVLDMKAEQQENTRQVFRPGTAWMLVSMLEDAVNSGTGTRAKIKGVNVGGKTGTNSDYKGVTFSGITPYYSCSIWVGDANDGPLKSVSGGRGAAPLWQAIMSRVHEELELENHAIIEDSPESLGLVQATVCSLSGKLATESCKLDTNFKPVTDWFHSDSVPTETCNMHMTIPFCTHSGTAATEFCDETQPRAVILLPPGHKAELLTQDKLAALLPGAVLNVPEGATTEDVLRLLAAQGKQCTLHTTATVDPGNNGSEEGNLLGGNGEDTPVG